MIPEAIKRFDGEYRWLSNFYPSPLVYDGSVYPTAEHAYQAAKTWDPELKELIHGCLDAATAKRRGRRVHREKFRPDWDQVKIEVMEEIVWSKFNQNTDLGTKLLATGAAYLEEGNLWSDFYWGVCRGRGENHLGRILMATRVRLGGMGPPATGRPPGGYTGRLYYRSQPGIPAGHGE